jgi:transcription termination factor Rho
LDRPLDRAPLDRPRERPPLDGPPVDRQPADRPLPNRPPYDRQAPGRPHEDRSRLERPRETIVPERGDRGTLLERRIDRIQRERDAARYRQGGARRPEPPRVDQVQNRSALARIQPSRSGMGGGGSRFSRGGRDSRKRDLLDGLNLLHRGISVDPYQRLVLETVPENLSTRVIDLIAPIGRGQRCLITSPPKAGKTMLLMAMAEAIIKNHPEVTVVVLLVDERPEEVTFFRRGVPCEVMASSNDMTPEDHVRTAEETVVRVAELVTDGKDVVLFLDSITRLARAYNIFAEGSGRTMSGGIDASTMYGPRRIFGAARKIEGGGSLTICGTALIDTGSRMDEVIFQEFKGTGNTEIVLNRDLANKRIYPSIDIILSGSRKEEKLYPVDVVSRIHILRRFLADRKPEEAILGLMKMMERYPTNRDLLRAVGS